MILDILPLAGGAARLVRVYGGEPCAVLPGAVPGPEGGEWPITELGDYCFSEKPRGLPGPEKTCRYEQAEDGTLRLTRAFGRGTASTSMRLRRRRRTTTCTPSAGTSSKKSPCPTACGSWAAVRSTTAGSSAV